MTTNLLLLALPAMVTGILLWFVGQAPEGYEDELGFHLGSIPSR